jgi:hypothetical protein
MGVFEDSAAAVAGVFAGAAGETIQYQRGETSVEATAWRSPQPLAFAADLGAGVLVEYESWEWHLAAAALEDLARPEQGDRIEAADGRIYEVLPVPGMGCYVGDALLRIHTKRIGIEE